MDHVAGYLKADDRTKTVFASAEQPDSMVQDCRILHRLALHVPALVSGPLQLDSQFWVAAERPAHLPRRKRALDDANFTSITANKGEMMLSAKPFNVGLFTSTGMLGTHGMWRIYLDLRPDSPLFPRPWRTWAVKTRQDVSIREILCATDWVDFVESYRAAGKSMLYPDWGRVVQDYDAVHVGLRAVAATEGFSFLTPHGVTAPPFWTVESTVAALELRDTDGS
jgi:hypothetical protein